MYVPHRPLNLIAYEIRRDWKTPSIGAVPYLKVMAELSHISGTYLSETADDIVLRFLTNAGTWRGENAKRIKAELNKMLKENAQ